MNRIIVGILIFLFFVGQAFGVTTYLATEDGERYLAKCVDGFLYVEIVMDEGPDDKVLIPVYTVNSEGKEIPYKCVAIVTGLKVVP